MVLTCGGKFVSSCPVARPTKYTVRLGEEICEAIASTARGLVRICEGNEGFPSARTVLRWLGVHEGFRVKYGLAKEAQADLLFDECLEIADDSTYDTVTTRSGEGCNKEWIMRSKLRIDTRRWMAEKLAPKKYGDKVTTMHEPGDSLLEVLAAIRSGEADE